MSEIDRRTFLGLSLGAAAGSLAGPAWAEGSADPALTRVFGGPLDLLVVSARDGEPVPGARVWVKGRARTTARDGRVPVEGPLFAWSPVTIEAPGFLLRRTLLRWDRTFSLWPISRDLPAAYVRHLVYGNGALLLRPRSREFAVIPCPLTCDDAPALASIREAAERVSRATGATFTVTSEAEAGDRARIQMVVDPHDPRVKTTGATAVFYRRNSGYFIEGGRLVLSASSVARSVNTIVHELGHVCFWHSPLEDDVMSISPTRKLVTRFSSRERAAFALMTARLPGSRFEDDDAHLGPYASLVAAGHMKHGDAGGPAGALPVPTMGSGLTSTVFTCA